LSTAEGKQCKGNLLLHFHGKTEHFLRLTVHVNKQQYEMEIIFACHCQQWLRERAAVLGYTFIVYIVIRFGLDLKQFFNVSRMVQQTAP
jgi:hypothetical protein